MPNNSTIFLGCSGKESWHIDQRHQRDVKGITKTDKPCTLYRRINIQNSGKTCRLICNNPNTSTGKPCKSDNHIWSKGGLYLKKIAIISNTGDQLFHVVCFIRIVGDQRIEIFVFPMDIVLEIYGMRLLQVIGREVTNQFADHQQGMIFIVSSQMCHTTLGMMC